MTTRTTQITQITRITRTTRTTQTTQITQITRITRLTGMYRPGETMYINLMRGGTQPKPYYERHVST